MDDDRADDAAAKWHSTVGGAVSVAAAVSEALGHADSATSDGVAVVSSRTAAAVSPTPSRGGRMRLLGTILTHFSQRYPRLPPLAAPDHATAAASSGAGTVTDAAAELAGAGSGAVPSHLDRAAAVTGGAGGSSSGGSDRSRPKPSKHYNGRREQVATGPWTLDPAPSSASIAAASRRALFAFDGMCVPLVPSVQLQLQAARGRNGTGADNGAAGATASPMASSAAAAGSTVTVSSASELQLLGAAASGSAVVLEPPSQPPSLSSVFEHASAIMRAVHAVLEEV